MLTIVIGSPLLFIGSEAEYVHRLIKSFWNLGHLIYFFALTWLLLGGFVFISKIGTVSVYLLVTLMIILLSLPVEYYQLMNAREFSYKDIFLNCLGSFLAVGFHPNTRIQQKKIRLPGQIFLLTVVLTQVYSAILDTIDWLQNLRQFPVLSNLESPLELARWRGDNLQILTLGPDRNHVLRMEFNQDAYSNLSFYKFQSDWRGYGCLAFMIYSEDTKSLPLYLRIHDHLHSKTGKQSNDRFNTLLTVLPGWNGVEINLNKIRQAPETREIDLARIEELIFFTHQAEQNFVVYFDNLKLINRGESQEKCAQ